MQNLFEVIPEDVPEEREIPEDVIDIISLIFLTSFTPYSSVSTVDFEQVNTDWTKINI